MSKLQKFFKRRGREDDAGGRPQMNIGDPVLVGSSRPDLTPGLFETGNPEALISALPGHLPLPTLASASPGQDPEGAPISAHSGPAPNPNPEEADSQSLDSNEDSIPHRPEMASNENRKLRLIKKASRFFSRRERYENISNRTSLSSDAGEIPGDLFIQRSVSVPHLVGDNNLVAVPDLNPSLESRNSTSPPPPPPPPPPPLRRLRHRFSQAFLRRNDSDVSQNETPSSSYETVANMPRSSEKSKYSQSESKVTAKSEQSARPQQTPHFSSQGENSASGWDEMTHAMVDPTDLRLGLPPRENPISFTDPNGLRNRAWSQSQLNLPLSEPLRSGSQSAESSENSFISDPFQMGNAGGDPMRQSQEFNARCARADSAYRGHNISETPGNFPVQSQTEFTIPRRPLPPSSHIFQAARRGDSQFSTLARRGSDQDFSPQPHSRRISSRGGTPLSPVKEASEAAERDSPRK